MTMASELPSRSLKKCWRDASLYTHRSDSLIFFLRSFSGLLGEQAIASSILTLPTSWTISSESIQTAFPLIRDSLHCNTSVIPDAPQLRICARLHSGLCENPPRQQGRQRIHQRSLTIGIRTPNRGFTWRYGHRKPTIGGDLS